MARFEQSQKLYKDSLDLWIDQLSYPGLYESERRRFVPTPLERIAKEKGVDLSEPKVPYKIFADELLQHLWKKADQAGSGVNLEKVSSTQK